MALTSPPMNAPVYLVAGVRTPFTRSGTAYLDLMGYQLGAEAIAGLLRRTAIDPATVDAVILGQVLQDVRTSNVAREAALTAGIPAKTPCHTVTQACISANQAIADGIRMIRTGEAGLVIAGGVDTASDPPILFPRAMRRKLLLAQRLRTLGDRLRLFLSFRPSDFVPQKPAIAEYLTGRVMGEDCELLAGRYQVARAAQDAFAARSHQLAAKAWEAGHFDALVTPVKLPEGKSVGKDNGVRGDSSETKLARLSPAFDPKGTITAGNASFLTDGAAVTLLASEQALAAYNLTPLARVVDYVFTGQDIHEELLLGPAYAVSRILQKNNLRFADVDVIELHEAFAAQVLANMAALSQPAFGGTDVLGELPMEKLNLWGGSLALGHPFGATGARILMQTAARLHAEGGKLGLLAACAAGGHGHAMLIERV